MSQRPSCIDLVNNHCHGTYEIGYLQSWHVRHTAAVTNPRGSERPILTLIRAFAEMADAYLLPDYEPGDRLLGQDGYFHEHAADLVTAMRAYLNFDVGRLDCGTLDRLITQLAEMAGVEVDQ